MENNIYIASSLPQSGKSMVLLHLMEMLSGHVKSLGFFRPVILDTPEDDAEIRLIRERYKLDLDPELMYGCNLAMARQMIADGDYDALQKKILNNFKTLDERCDVVICSGPNLSATSSFFKSDFNTDLATNMGCVVVPVINAFNIPKHEIVGITRMTLESLREHHCKVLMAVVNRIAPEIINEVSDLVNKSLGKDPLIYCLPEYPSLGMPTVVEIADTLGLNWVNRPEGIQNNQVEHYKVAAMQLPHFLDHFEDGSLVITPGDRADIVVGCIAADISTAYPKVAGILLTGGLKSSPEVTKLLSGLSSYHVPILSSEMDTFKTVKCLSSVPTRLHPEDVHKISGVLGVTEPRMPSEEILEGINLIKSSTRTPFMFEQELISRAKANKQHIVLPESKDLRILQAAEILRLRNVVDITILGEPEMTRRHINQLGLKLPDVQIIDPVTSNMRQAYADKLYELRKSKGMTEETAYDLMSSDSYYGTMMVYQDDADGMVSGAMHTTQHTIRPAFQFIRTKPDTRIVSSVFLMCLADRILVYGDCAVNPDPSAEELADIAIGSAATAITFGIEPQIAMLSYSSGKSGKGKDVEKVRQATNIVRKLRPDLNIEGPIQYDAAVDPTVAKAKMPDSKVAGKANVCIFPDLNTGNNTYKAVQRSSGAVAIGPILQGLNKPVNDLSRGCLVPDIVNTVAITAIQAQGIGD